MKAIMIATVAGILMVPAAYAETQSELSQLETYCAPDVERLCKGVPYGDGKVKACLEEHKKDISVGCAEALERLKAG